MSEPLGLFGGTFDGFGDFSFANESAALQVFAIWLIIAGTTFVSLLFAFVTNALVSRRIVARRR